LENARGCLEMIRVKSLLVNRSISVREELEGTVTMVMATIDRRSLSLTSVKRFESLALPQATSTDILMAKPRQVLTDHTNITRDDIKQEAGSIFNPPRTQQPEQISNPPSYAKVFKLPSNEPHSTIL
jgi:hypothetical protein